MPRTKKQFRRGLKSISSTPEIKVSPLNGEPYQPIFKGWNTSSFTLDKLESYKKRIKDMEFEVEKNEDILNEVKSCFDLFEKTTLEMKLKAIINSLPSFTEDLMQAALFISEFTCDSDDEMSDTSEDAALNTSISGNVSDIVESDSESIHVDVPWDNDVCENLQERIGESLVPELQPVESTIQNFQKRTSDEKLNLFPVVIIPKLKVLNAKKNSGTDTRNKEINHSLQRIVVDETKSTPNCLHVVKDFEQSVKKTQSLENHSKNNIDSDEEETFALVYKGSDEEEEHCKAEIECRPKAIGNTMPNTPVIRIDKTNSRSVLKNVKRNTFKRINHKNTYNYKIRNRRLLKKNDISLRKSLNFEKQRITVVHRLNNSEASVTEDSDKKNEKTINTFLDAVSEVTSVSQILSLVKRKFTCKYCEVSFIRKGNLGKHLKVCPMRDDGLSLKKKKQKNDEGPCTCKLCGAWLKLKKNLPRHNEMMHNLVRSHKCVVCNWGFYNERVLQHHVMSRHGLSLTKHMKCPYCECAFRRRDDLRTHCRKHKALYFLCSICFETFADESAWKSHERDHGFMCDVCDFSTQNEDEVAAHKLTHLQLVTHKCAVCSKLFNKKRFVTRHMKQVHKLDVN